jgi:hypothetical protein
MQTTGWMLPTRWAGERTVLSAVLLALGLMGAGCFPKAGEPPGVLSASAVASASARSPGVTAGTLSAGRDLFLAKCNGCHKYPDLAAIPEASWPGIVDKMGNKAHLAPDERNEVLHFILASRSDQAAR